MTQYTIPEFKALVETLRDQFDLVRVVDPAATREVDVARCDQNGLCYQANTCFAVWQTRMQRCLNCISMRALREGERQCKFEFIDEDVYYVIASPIQVDDRPLAMELICRVGTEALLQSYRGDELLERIASYNEQFRVDESTGLYNRHYLELRLRELMVKARQNGARVTVAMVDVDHFSQINETYGHAMGDAVLLTLGQVLSGAISQRRGDFAVRFGGDEFVLVFDDIPQELLEQRIHKLMARVSALRIDGLPDTALTLSIGCYRSDEQGQDTVESMLAEADRRLYMAKEHGRNCAVFEADKTDGGNEP